jgi:hypothetical protein
LVALQATDGGQITFKDLKPGEDGKPTNLEAVDRILKNKEERPLYRPGTWFYLWHHEGRRARHGTSMMAPDYAHWHGMYEVAERFYQGLIPQARELAEHAASEGKKPQAAAVSKVIEDILARPEHAWQKQGE